MAHQKKYVQVEPTYRSGNSISETMARIEKLLRKHADKFTPALADKKKGKK